MVFSRYSSAKLVVIVGATGSQGAALVDHLIASSSEYRIRAINQDPESDDSKALATKGVQVFPGDASVPGDVEAALTGAHVLFGTTEGLGLEEEVKIGKSLVDAAKAAWGVKLFVWSGGDSESAIATYAKEKDLATVVLPAGSTDFSKVFA
ncbi:hypothetical protein P7C70_g6197, partial [Phenoliferia sp. Uapishka_3]